MEGRRAASCGCQNGICLEIKSTDLALERSPFIMQYSLCVRIQAATCVVYEHILQQCIYFIVYQSSHMVKPHRVRLQVGYCVLLHRIVPIPTQSVRTQTGPAHATQAVYAYI